MQRELAQANLHYLAIELWGRAVVGEDRDLPRLACLGEDLNGSRSDRLLAVIDLPQVKYLMLQHPTVRRARSALTCKRCRARVAATESTLTSSAEISAGALAPRWQKAARNRW
ncbi:MAG: hypothetical protein WA970_03600 [Gammaproteobacteria bacterium]